MKKKLKKMDWASYGLANPYEAYGLADSYTFTEGAKWKKRENAGFVGCT